MPSVNGTGAGVANLFVVGDVIGHARVAFGGVGANYALKREAALLYSHRANFEASERSTAAKFIFVFN